MYNTHSKILMVVNPTNPYTQMQIEFYDREASKWSETARDPVVGSFDLHNRWPDYELLFERVPDHDHSVGLDFACGPGRNLVKYGRRFQRLDGVDLSPVNIARAKSYTSRHGLSPNLYVSTGVDMPGVPSDAYDFVMSTIALQHICVHEIRIAIISDIHRVLKPGGVFTAQMGYGSPSPMTVPYHANHYAATSTNRACDVCVSSPQELLDDLLAIGFHSFEYHIRPVGPGDAHPNWIFFSAIK